MWTTLLAEIGVRFLATRTYFHAVVGPPLTAASSTIPVVSPAEMAAKGLMFVQLYAVYEYTVCSMVRAAWAEMKGRMTTIQTIRMELLGAVLNAELSAVIDCERKRTWEKRIALFRRVNSSDAIDLPDNFFPADGSHYKVQQLQTIWDLFGISGHPLPRTPLIGLIDHELVEHRNAIAHGRKTAEEVGRGYSVPDIHRKTDESQEICIHLVATLQNHCANHANLAR